MQGDNESLQFAGGFCGESNPAGQGTGMVLQAYGKSGLPRVAKTARMPRSESGLNDVKKPRHVRILLKPWGNVPRYTVYINLSFSVNFARHGFPKET